MRQAYLDASSGISGDMFLGALLDAGFDAHRLLEELKKLLDSNRSPFAHVANRPRRLTGMRQRAIVQFRIDFACGVCFIGQKAGGQVVGFAARPKEVSGAWRDD